MSLTVNEFINKIALLVEAEPVEKYRPTSVLQRVSTHFEQEPDNLPIVNGGL